MRGAGHAVRGIAFALLAVLGAACAAPVSAVRVDPTVVHQELTGSVLSTGEPSRFSRNVLFLHGLHEAFEKDAEAALARLRTDLLAGRGGDDELFALAELSFHRGQETGAQAHFRASAVYAWAFLFPEGGRAPDAFDPRLRRAADLYNRGLTAGLASAERAVVALAAGTYELPWGKLEVAFDREQLIWGGRELTDFVPVAELEVRGLALRFRRPGIGAALAAGIVPVTPDQQVRDFVAPRVKVAATALLRIPRAARQLASDRVAATLELYAGTDTDAVEIAGRTVPLEQEPTAALAWSLQEGSVWERELKGFFGNIFQIESAVAPQLVSAEPYRPGRIPVVFVHGTASSIGRWAEMYNRLQNDPVVRQRYQFWFFQYDSGAPIGFSAMLLREALARAIAKLDPEGRDEALRRMVVIGHSQGGLLTKMTAVSSGTRFWDNISTKPFDEMPLSPETRALAKRSVFVEPLPFVQRVVFISTPHRGSYLAGIGLATYMLQRLVTFPRRLAAAAIDISSNREHFSDGTLSSGRLPTAVDNMSPAHPFVRTLVALPLAPGVAGHSIVAVKGDGPVEAGDDGVVKYESAHIDGVVSEMVVRSEHSSQGRPETIEEIRRILILHAGGQ
jgi:pimeloyl-ACP methyl ester carboxylesterase